MLVYQIDNIIYLNHPFCYISIILNRSHHLDSKIYHTHDENCLIFSLNICYQGDIFNIHIESLKDFTKVMILLFITNLMGYLYFDYFYYLSIIIYFMWNVNFLSCYNQETCLNSNQDYCSYLLVDLLFQDYFYLVYSKANIYYFIQYMVNFSENLMDKQFC